MFFPVFRWTTWSAMWLWLQVYELSDCLLFLFFPFWSKAESHLWIMGYSPRKWSTHLIFGIGGHMEWSNPPLSIRCMSIFSSRGWSGTYRLHEFILKLRLTFFSFSCQICQLVIRIYPGGDTFTHYCRECSDVLWVTFGLNHVRTGLRLDRSEDFPPTSRGIDFLSGK